MRSSNICMKSGPSLKDKASSASSPFQSSLNIKIFRDYSNTELQRNTSYNYNLHELAFTTATYNRRLYRFENAIIRSGGLNLVFNFY